MEHAKLIIRSSNIIRALPEPKARFVEEMLKKHLAINIFEPVVPTRPENVSEYANILLMLADLRSTY